MTFPARRMFLAGAFGFLAVVYLLAQWRDLARGPHVDEVEHLHVAVLMARGQQMYVDFSEHHPPLFWGMLRPLVTATEGVEEMRLLVTRARLLTGFITALAIFSAALIVWRVSANAWTVVTFVGLLFAGGGIWRNGLGDIRPDSTALAFWWSGAALVLLARRPTVQGVGIGLVFVASLVKPQWPLSSIVIGIVFLVQVRRSLVRASVPAVLVAAAGIGATALLADLDVFWFHVVTLTRGMADAYYNNVAAPFYGCPLLFRPWRILLAAIVVAAWGATRRAGAPLVLLAIGLASICEILFLYPFPAVDTRFYAFWVIAAACILALLPQAAAHFVVRLRHLPAAAAVVALVLSLDLIGAPRAQPDRYWLSSRWIAARLAPGDTIWNGWDRHPIDAHDASYYWISEAIPVSMRLLRTDTGRRYLPPVTEAALPPCRLDPRVRFLGKPKEKLPVVTACFQRLRDQGLITPTPFGQLWMVRR